jgi:hypothetical protein
MRVSGFEASLADMLASDAGTYRTYKLPIIAAAMIASTRQAMQARMPRM